MSKVLLNALVLHLLLAPVATADAYLPIVGSGMFGRPITWATCSSIVDGDTIWVDLDGDGEKDVKVRFTGVDTPENTWGKDECYADEAEARTRELLLDKRIALERDVSDVDRYDRLLRYVYLPDGRFINGILVQEGYAVAKEYPPDTRYADWLEAREAEACAAGFGGWGACGW